MQPLKTLRWIVLVAMLPSLTSCYSWSQVPPQDVTAERLEGKNRLRLATSDGWEGELWRPVVRDSLLVGMERFSTPTRYREILITSLQEVEERRLHMAKTLAMSAVTAGMAVGVVYGFACLILYPALGGHC
jgi:hypothetical protein